MNSIVRYDPIRSLFTFPGWMDELEETSQQRGLKIHETEKNIVVEAVVAGVPSEDVEITIEDGVLVIRAETSEEKKTKNEYRSSSYQYYYTVALSGGKWNKTEAHIDHGVAKITIPKAEAAKRRKIKIKTKNG